MRRRLRRAAALALVPLSAIPLVAVAPMVAPSVEQRVNELRGEPQHDPVPSNPERRR
jgi:hypothetical protein